VGTIDGTPTPWDDLSIAFLGKAFLGLVSIISFPEEALDNTQVQVKMVSHHILQHQEELNDLLDFPPVLHEEVDSKLITT
jgi:hypothetical protein